jgi:hypothetical protein
VLHANGHALQVAGVTFNIFQKEQLSLVIRYVFNIKMYEKLVALVESSSTTEKVFFDIFKNVMSV